MATNAQNGGKTAHLATIKQEMDELVSKANTYLAKGKSVEYSLTIQRLKEREKQYEGIFVTTVYDDIKAKPNPMLEAIKMRNFTTIGHTEVKDNDTHIVTSVELSNKVKPIALLKFCKYAKAAGCNVSTDWQYTVEKLGESLTYRTAQELKISPNDMAQLKKDYYISGDTVKKMGKKVVTSNRCIDSLLQKVIDQIMYVDDGNGKNKYKCNNHDRVFLLNCYTRKGRESFTIMVSKDGALTSVITEMCYVILNGLKYNVSGYRKNKQAAVAETPAAPAATPATDKPKVKRGKAKKETAETPTTTAETVEIVAA